MKKLIFIFFVVCYSHLSAQLTRLNSGTNVIINYLSVLGPNILIGGQTDNYLVKSYHAGEQLLPLPGAGPSINATQYQRLDTSNIFAVSSGGPSTLYRSYDGGNSWRMKYYFGAWSSGIAFFDTLNGLSAVSLSNQLLRTSDGGVTWTTSTLPLANVSTFKIFTDSMVMVGLTGQGTGGDFYISKDRGLNWQFCWGMGGIPIDFARLNNDTIVGISGMSPMGDTFFTRTLDGTTWLTSKAPFPNCASVYFRNRKECYVVGSNSQNKAMIAKSEDAGATWSTYETGFNGTIWRMAFLSDSVALLSGDKGLLLRWNFKQTVFTGLNEQHSTRGLNLSVFPNPATDRIYFKPEAAIEWATIQITSVFGETQVHVDKHSLSQEMDVSALKSGVYFITITVGNKRTTTKFIKE